MIGLLFTARVERCEEHSHDEHEDREDAILGAEEGHGAFLNPPSNLLHLVGAGVLLLDPLGFSVSERQGD